MIAEEVQKVRPRDGADGRDGVDGEDGQDGRDAPSMEEIVEELKPIIARGIANGVQRGTEGFVRQEYVDQRLQLAIQAALDQVAANPPPIDVVALAPELQPHLDGRMLAEQTQPHLDPIGFEFRDPDTHRVIIHPKTGEPMSYEQHLGGKFVFKFRPSAMAVKPVGAK